MVNENVIAPLEQSLRHIQQTLNQKEIRLREIEREADGLKGEIDDLKNSAEEIRKAMRRLLDGGQSRKHQQNRSHELDLDLMSDYDDLYNDAQDDIMPRYSAPKRNANNYSSGNNYSQRAVVPMHRGGSKHDIPAINPDIEVKSYRFREKTITQACIILMREFGRPLHVNEIYNRLLEGGMVFTGNNPTISIAVSLNRNRRFRKVAPGTFDLNIREATAS